MRRNMRFFLSVLLCAGLLFSAAATAQAEDGIAVDENHFPDPVFRQWILDEKNLNGAGADGVLTSEEVQGITEIQVSNQGIASLEGIETFVNLEKLYCSNNLLTTLDVSGNPKLKTLLCDINRLTELDLSHNPALINLNCELNYLTSLNLTGCTELDWLYCRHNLLSQLDLSTNTKLTFIETFDNRLTSIDVSMLTQLGFLHIDHNKLTELDLSHNTALVNDGSGFVVRNNYIRKLILPDHENLTVKPDVYAEQNDQDGYAETEWYLDQGFTQPVEGDIQAKGQTLYAKWIPNPYTISFHANGGTGTIAPISTVYDAQVQLPSQGMSRKGYTFTGWMGYVDGKDRLYAPGETVSNLTGKKSYQNAITLYAQWEPYQAKLDANGGRFSDGQETVVLPVTGESAPLSLPGDQVVQWEGKELLAWAQTAAPDFSQNTPFYLPEAEVTVPQGTDFYAQWRQGQAFVVYHGGDDSTVRLQKRTGEPLSLYGGDTFLRDGKPLLVWNTRPDGTGTSYLPGASVASSALKGDITHLYALWVYPTETELTLNRDSYVYTGRSVALEAQAAVQCAGAPVEGTQVEYVYYLASHPDTPLPAAPTEAGSYLVRAVFNGDDGRALMESSSEAKAFTITQGTAALAFEGPQRFLWTGKAPDMQAPTLTLNGAPWQAELTYRYRAQGTEEWTSGLPTAAGSYQLQAALGETASHTAAVAETTVQIFCFQEQEGLVTGSVPVELPGGSGSCQVVVALYDQGSGQLLDRTVRTCALGQGTVTLTDLRLDSRSRENLTVKVFLLGGSLSPLGPASTYAVWRT